MFGRHLYFCERPARKWGRGGGGGVGGTLPKSSRVFFFLFLGIWALQVLGSRNSLNVEALSLKARKPK